MHAVEKIIAHAAAKKQVSAGEIVTCHVDVAGINDLYLQVVRSFEEMEAVHVASPKNVVMFLDHYAPASTIRQAQNQKEFRAFCAAQGIESLMDINEGVCHQVLADKGFSRPGRVIVVTDSHTTTHGAFGAFGTGVGATDMAVILATGTLWFRVPEVIRIRLDGKLREGVFAKDVILYIIGKLGADYAIYKAVEFTGEAITRMSISERMALCNMTTEMGAKNCYIQPDDVTMQFLREKGVADDCTIFTTDDDFVFADELSFDVSTIGVQVAAPSSVDTVFSIEKYCGTKIDQAYLGSCTGGRTEDLAIAAHVLAGKKISPTTRLVVVPASKEVFLESMRKGYVQTLVEAGATFVTPSCAACLGTHEGLLAPNEVCITATNRNFPGRMGDKTSQLFLASPAAVAASALTGVITDPTPYLEKGAH